MLDKIIFLDVDGVLNSVTFYEKFLSEGIDCDREDILDQTALCRLAKIVRDTNAGIVISSSWRWDANALRILTTQLAVYGIIPIGTTIQEIRVNLSRAEEIRMWLKEHPEVNNYVVLDDDVMDVEEIASHHIKTNFNKGLEMNHVEQAKKILNGELING